MSIHTRVRRLEVSRGTDDTCHTCGAPAMLAPAYIITHDLSPLPKCPACGRALNEEGRPLPEHYKRIVLPREFGDPIRDAAAPESFT